MHLGFLAHRLMAAEMYPGTMEIEIFVEPQGSNREAPQPTGGLQSLDIV